jgi:hypothetical protein
LSEGLRNGPEQSLSHWQCGSLMKGAAAHSSSRLRPVWDYTLCTLVNDLHISERLTGSQTNQTPQRPREMPYRDLLGVKCFTDRGQELVRRLPSVSKVRSARRGGVGSRHNAALAAPGWTHRLSTCERICERNAAQLPVVLGTRRDGLNAKPAVACMFETWASIQHRHRLAHNPEVAGSNPVPATKESGPDQAKRPSASAGGRVVL